MARSAVPLTDSRIRQTKAPDRPTKLADGGGMYLLLRPDGSRYWRLDYRFDGKRKTLALGVYPEISLGEARRRRRAAKALLAAGQDPGAVRKAGKANKPGTGTDEQAYALAMLGEGMWDWDLRSGQVRHNAQWARLMGLDERRQEHDWQQAVAALHEQDRETVMTAIRHCLDGTAAFECEHRIRHADGTAIWVRNRGEVMRRDAEGTPLRMVGSLREVTEQRHAALVMRCHNLLLQTIAAVNEMLMAELPEQELMARICEELVRDNLFRMAWIGLVDEDGVTVRPVAEAGIARGYPAQADIRCDGSPQGQGPTGNAIRSGITVINDDTETDRRFAPWRERARAQGYRSSAATPLRMHGRVIGALNVYSDEAHAFGPEKRMLLEKLAADLGVAMGNRAALAALRESEERFRLISSVATDLLYSCRQTGAGFHAIDWATASADRIFGYTLDEILEQGCWRSYVHPDDLPEFDRNITHLAPGQRSECELRILARDGAIHYIRAYSIEVKSDDGQHRLYGACQDITDRKRAAEALRESEARFRAMMEHSADWIWSIDAAGRYTYSNQRGMASLGYTAEAFLAMDLFGMLHPDDLPLFRATFENAVSSRQGWQNVVLRRRHSNGSYRTFESNASVLFGETGQLTGFQGVDRDITERRQAEARIAFLAHHDALTGLPNRVLLRDRFEQAVAQRTRPHVAMLFLDLDNFKVVNDSLGHAAGDELLLAAVSRLSHRMRDSDTISRQGGDEFVLLLNDIPDLDTVKRIATDILSHLAEPVEINGHVLNASCSIGIAIYPEDGSDFDSLLQKADTAMYNAKGAGRNSYRFFDEQMNLQAQEHLMLQHRLHQALYRAELEVHYQPQLEIGSGKVIGVEALLRWRNPELGEVAPARFIPVAESCGLIVPIGAWVLEQACLQAQAWRQAGLSDLAVSVNLSAMQFRRFSLIEMVAGVLGRSGLPPHLLELELTESILLQDVESTLDTVQQLKRLGVRLSIDDFGTGYSSLSYLKRFAVDRLKIDQSFMRDVNTDPDNAAIVRAVIQLARSLRLDIVAEGVETPAQLAFLREEGCREAQGYLFSRPLPPAAMEAFLRERIAPDGAAP
ncbi:MAG: diguanylate cyclase [Thiobacillus sp. 65-1059]|nr:MAG: diguanylate cyclase [Thiobacillus sp. 65-1059]